MYKYCLESNVWRYEAPSVSWNIRDWNKISFVKCERVVSPLMFYSIFSSSICNCNATWVSCFVQIYIPMNEKSQHWYLLVIAADQRHVYVIDTLKYNTWVRKRDVDRMVYWSCVGYKLYFFPNI